MTDPGSFDLSLADIFWKFIFITRMHSNEDACCPLWWLPLEINTSLHPEKEHGTRQEVTSYIPERTWGTGREVTSYPPRDQTKRYKNIALMQFRWLAVTVQSNLKYFSTRYKLLFIPALQYYFSAETLIVVSGSLESVKVTDFEDVRNFG